MSLTGSDETKIDAVLCPLAKVVGRTDPARGEWYRREFGPALGVARVAARHAGGGLVLVTKEAADVSRFHPKGHDLEGQERYDWIDRGDGIYYGVLIPAPAPAAAPGPDRLAQAAREYGARLKAEYDRLKGLDPGRLTPEDVARLPKLERWLKVVGAGPPAPGAHGGTHAG